jgi:hypothetical protein
VGCHMVQIDNLLPKIEVLWGDIWYRLVICYRRGFVGCYIVETGNLLPKMEVLWGVMWYRLVICYRR